MRVVLRTASGCGAYGFHAAPPRRRTLEDSEKHTNDMAKYYIRKMAEGMSRSGESRFPQLIPHGSESSKSLAEKIQAATSLSKGCVEGVLAELARLMAGALSEGKTVSLDGIGTFRTMLGLAGKERRGPWQDSAGRETTLRNVAVKTVNFSPSGELTGRIKAKITLERVGGTSGKRLPRVEPLAARTAVARQLIADNGYLKVGGYAEATGLPRSTAAKELRGMKADPACGIASTGQRASLIYIAAKA